VVANGQLMKAWQYRPLIVAYRNGSAVRLGDVANVIDSVQDDKQFAMLYGGEYAPKAPRESPWRCFASPAATPSTW